MPWFKIDDTSHNHLKFVRAGNAALGLWLRCGAYAAAHLTEGVVPAEIAKAYGTAPQAAKLVKAGLWHPAGHDCPRCVQPEPGNFVMHDFFEGGRNTTRAQHEANKKAAADRAAKSRANRKPKGTADDSAAIRDGFDDETNANHERFAPQFPDSIAGQDGLSHRTPADGAADAHAAALPLPTTSFGSSGKAAAGGEPVVATSIDDLKRAVRAAGLNVSWTMQASQHAQVQRVMEEVGVAAMVDHAVKSSQRRGGPPTYAFAWLSGWLGLEPGDPAGDPLPLPMAAGGDVVPFQRPGARSVTDERVKQALSGGPRLRAILEARRKEQS